VVQNLKIAESSIFIFSKLIIWEARLFGAALYGIAILLLVHFRADLFGVNFTKIIFFFCFLFQFFLIY